MEMLTSLTSQTAEQNGPSTLSVSAGETGEPKSSAEGRSDAEVQGSKLDDGAMAQGTDDSQGVSQHPQGAAVFVLMLLVIDVIVNQHSKIC